LDNGDIRCMDDTVFNLHFLYGQKGDFKGKDMCFVSRMFKKPEEFKPFEYKRDPVLGIKACARDLSCIEKSTQFSFFVTDNKVLNEKAGLGYPMMSMQLVVDVEF